MRGTEKQIKWAEEIQKTTLETIDFMIDYSDKESRKVVPAEKVDALISKLTRVREALVNAPYAGDIIDCFQLVRADATMQSRVGSVMTALKINVAESDYQHKLLDR